MSETTKFKLGDTLRVLDIKHLSGRVLRIQIASFGVEYELRYFDGVEPRQAWFFEEELEVLQSRPQINLADKQ